MGGGAPHAEFGGSLTAGDFDGDGYADLAIGAWGHTVDGLDGAGAVDVLYGSATGLSSDRVMTITQATSGVPGDPGAFDAFGRSLASGDLDGDGFDDLAVGIPWDTVGVIARAGAVTVFPGSASGLVSSDGTLWDQDTPGIEDQVEEGEEGFGEVLAIGDFDADGADDLAVAVPLENVLAGTGSQGAVNVLYGTSDGLTAARNALWHEETPGVPGAAEDGDEFGSGLAAGDLDGDGAADLAIGSPGETLGSRTIHHAQGLVTVLYGGSTGLTTTGSQSWTQGSPGVPGITEDGDRFGGALAIANYGHSRAGDLAVASVTEDVGRVRNAGSVNVLYGRSSGLSGIAAQSWSQASTGVLGAAEPSDFFGSSLTP